MTFDPETDSVGRLGLPYVGRALLVAGAWVSLAVVATLTNAEVTSAALLASISWGSALLTASYPSENTWLTPEDECCSSTTRPTDWSRSPPHSARCSTSWDVTLSPTSAAEQHSSPTVE